MRAHSLFGEDQSAWKHRFAILLQKGSAQQWQFLHLYAVLSCFREIHLNRVLRPFAITGAPVEVEHPDTNVLCETRKQQGHTKTFAGRCCTDCRLGWTNVGRRDHLPT